ncbi:unnamed protein product, partial [Polarella glacialis]
LTLSGPHAGLRAREVCSALAETWAPEVVASVARSTSWEALLPQPPSLHKLLGPYSRRAAGAQGSGCRPPAIAGSCGGGSSSSSSVPGSSGPLMRTSPVLRPT